MRLFLAVDLPPQSRKKLQKQLEVLQKEYPDIRWVTPDNFHLTLHFFGDVTKPQKLTNQIREAIYDVPNFHLYSSEGDLFIKNKITLYLGFKRSKVLESLVKKVKDRLQITPQEKFVPHLTLGRYRIPSKQQYFVLKKKIRKLQFDIEFKVNSIILYESILKSQKPVYKAIARFELI